MPRKPKEQLPASGKAKLKKAEKAAGKAKGKVATWLKMARMPSDFLAGQLLEADGMQCLAKQLEKAQLTDINLSHNNLGDDGMKFLCNALKANNQLRKLNVSANSVGDGGGLAFGTMLCRNRILDYVNLSGNQLTCTSVEAIATALRVRQDPEDGVTITTIDLSWNFVQHRGCRAVAKAMDRCTTPAGPYGRFVVILGGQAGPFERPRKDRKEGERNESAAGIGDEGCINLCEGLKRCQLPNCHDSLQLWHNDIGKDGAKALAELLRANECITDANLSWNSLGSDGGEKIGNLLVGPTVLRTLNLSHNIIGRTGGVSLAQIIDRSLPSLTMLNLSHNELEVEASNALAKALTTNTTLKKLDISYNPNIGASKEADLGGDDERPRWQPRQGHAHVTAWQEMIQANKHMMQVSMQMCELSEEARDFMRDAVKLSPLSPHRIETGPGAEEQKEGVKLKEKGINFNYGMSDEDNTGSKKLHDLLAPAGGGGGGAMKVRNQSVADPGGDHGRRKSEKSAYGA
eukprot:TRINITY_DN60423_c0_g1_i1.p1 TRINITY_DN60423_c0_g1~~TRINITY_DN60423_c0_g1_i1.p1  ORF type:complete len:547 (+),score=179.64 TRINITY_DN60423_c0_g1_i1:91-1641(+)